MAQALAENRDKPPKDGKRFRVVTATLRSSASPSDVNYIYTETPKQAWNIYHDVTMHLASRPPSGVSRSTRIAAVEVWSAAEGLWLNYNAFLRRMAHQ